MGNDAGPKLESSTMSTVNMSNSPPADPDVTAPQGDDTEASTITVNTKTPTASFPPPKTDKPRPHGCTTCGRAFARLEHLKRHERSHTKEKPFECPECKRCFARRDLLLRHQQKLHQSTAPSARPRNRRESASGGTIGQSRARKNSVAGPVQSAPPNPASMRPRANTISVVDSAAIQMMAGAANGPVARMPPSHSRHDSLIGLPFHYSHNQFPGMSSVMGHRGVQHGLPKLETNGLSFDQGLRTAPPNAIFRNDFMENLFGAPTIDPQALHVGMESPQSIGVDPLSPGFHGLPDLSSQAHFGLEDFFISDFGNQLTFNNLNDNAVDGSSSSAISTASPGGMSDAMIDGSNNPASTAPGTSSAWAPAMVSPQMGNPYNIDFPSHVFPDLMTGAPVSPHPMQHGMLSDAYFTPPPSSMNSGSPSVMSNLNAQNMNQTLNFGHGPETPTSINGSTHGTSPVSTITDSTRNAILGALSTASLGSTLVNRRSSFSVNPSPSSAHAKGSPDPANNLPSTQSLQRYVAAYLTYFHPHLPFLHIATLSFEIPARPAKNDLGSIGGSACLVLSMAAIGALYEKEHDRARELFEMAKKMIQTYLEQRRKANVRKAGFRGSSSEQDAQGFHDSSTDTPVWLVQSMLLNVVYGHSCGDQLVGKIAETHCAALVSLAQGADLLRQPHNYAEQDTPMSDVSDEHAEWLKWKATEERKRTLYAIFILSSLLVSAYNHSPALTNSEILLELPCDEEFFEAETSGVFNARGGVGGANHNRVTFHDALGDLLRTNEKQRRLSINNGHLPGNVFAARDLPPTTLKPSTFGCLVLINALHNYIWETRQRHHSNVWTNEETEKMHRHIEPALRAWQAAWQSNPHHSPRRPNPFGKGPLSADAMPLLDLAYVRLFVNLSRSKGQFWERDWDGMAEELARGSEIVQHAEQSLPGPEPAVSDSLDHMDTSAATGLLDNQSDQSPLQPSLANRTTSRREKHLRKAAYFAADSLSTSDRLDVTLADFTRQELPPQSALCAFDCAQVLAEWVATLQDRVGQYLGILGQDEVEFYQVPAIMLLEEEDVQLLRKVQDVLDGLEKKMGMEFLQGVAGGYAVKILRASAHTMAKSTSWPVSRLMIQCLETHANHIKARAERSVRPVE